MRESKHVRIFNAYIFCCLVKGLRQLTDGKRHGEEIESVPAPGKECDEEKHPLLQVQKSKKLEGIRRRIHCGFESGYAGRNIPAYTHMLLMMHFRGRRVLNIVFLYLGHGEMRLKRFRAQSLGEGVGLRSKTTGVNRHFL
jgi:hypothetical protein